MLAKTKIILIHGTWCNGNIWGDFVVELEKLGLEVYTPTLRYHDLPYKIAAEKVANLSLTDFVDDLSELLLSLDSPPIILGHSLGGLLAQLLAAKHPNQHKGLILLGTAPIAGIFALYPTMLATFYKHYLQFRFWNKPLYPEKDKFFKYITNNQPKHLQEDLYKQLVPESGRVYAEMGFWFIDRNHAATVDTSVIETPVLIITGTEDKVVVPNISKATAKKYQNSTFVLLKGSDHMYQMGEFMPITVNKIQKWCTKNSFI